jgi:hypothetical protein
MARSHSHSSSHSAKKSKNAANSHYNIMYFLTIIGLIGLFGFLYTINQRISVLEQEKNKVQK